MVILKLIDKILAQTSIFFIKIYQYTLSPDKGLPSLWLKGKICAHEPHCSQYSILSFKRYGFLSGFPKVIERVFSCVGSKKKIYDPHKYDIVFFSSAPIGVPFLKQLNKDKRFDIKGIVTNPDEKSGRGMELKPNIIKTEGEKIIKSKDIRTPNSLRLDSKKYAEEANNFKLRLEAKKPDYIVVIAYGKIIPQYILDIPKIAPINVHGSLLPKYRGASPIQSVFLNNEEKSGITIMKMDATMDTGNMIDKLSTKLNFDRTTIDLIERMKKKGPRFLNHTLINYGKGLLGEVKQNEKQATYCQKIEKDEGEISINKDKLENVYKKYRGYALRPKIYFNFSPFVKGENYDKSEQRDLKQKRVIIEKLKIDEKLFKTEKNKALINGKELNKSIIDISFKPEGKKSMNRKSFKSGYIK
ncbi:MAG TPA: membrane protein insertion efficiency factor YidD [Candidatus Absconditabacterales bacterium]|nr:membrane protein insertion efficiency factor YidD [Candidatus Absconditabacterales bacterium]